MKNVIIIEYHENIEQKEISDVLVNEWLSRIENPKKGGNDENYYISCEEDESRHGFIESQSTASVY